MRDVKNKSLLQRIAREAGVSVMTVSRVVSGRMAKYRAARERAKRVLEVAARYNYRPSAAARTVATGRFHAASLLLPGGRDQQTVLFAGLLDGIHDRLAEADYHLNVARLPDEAALVQTNILPKALRETLSDGFLVNYARDLPEAAAESVRRLRVPLVWINFGHKVDCVDLNDFGGGRMATEFLLDAGHRRILYLHHLPSTHYSATERAEGYAAAMRAAGLKPIVWREDAWHPVDLVEARYVKLLRSSRRPTAVISYSRQTTLVVLAAVAAVGLRVPEELAVIQFGEEDYVLPGFHAVTVRLPWNELGRVAAAMLLEMIEKPGRRFPRRRVPMLLLEADKLALMNGPPPPGRLGPCFGMGTGGARRRGRD